MWTARTMLAIQARDRAPRRCAAGGFVGRRLRSSPRSPPIHRAQRSRSGRTPRPMRLVPGGSIAAEGRAGSDRHAPVPNRESRIRAARSRRHPGRAADQRSRSAPRTQRLPACCELPVGRPQSAIARLPSTTTGSTGSRSPTGNSRRSWTPAVIARARTGSSRSCRARGRCRGTKRWRCSAIPPDGRDPRRGSSARIRKATRTTRSAA